MAHYAKINKDNIVEKVIVAEQDFIDSGALGDPNDWIQTSYNVSGGSHKNNGNPLRKNYAGVGYTYDPEINAFIPPQIYDSWKLNQDTCLWEPPIPYPDEGDYKWDEKTKSWIEVKL